MSDSWVMLGQSSASSRTPSCGTPYSTDRASESGTTDAGSAEATRILLAPSMPTTAPQVNLLDHQSAPRRLYPQRRRHPRALQSSGPDAREGTSRRQPPSSSLRIAQRVAKLPANSAGASPLLQRLALRRVTAELATAQHHIHRMGRQLTDATSDASSLATQLNHLQRLLHGTRGELERGGYELSMARSLLQQYHRAVEQLLRAVAAAREGGGVGQEAGGALLEGAVVAAAQKLRVTNLQLEASRYVLDVCQDALATADPAGGLSLVASVQHTTTSTTMTTTSDHLHTAPPAPNPTSPTPESLASPSPSRSCTPTPTPPPDPTPHPLALALATPQAPPPPPAFHPSPSFDASATHHHLHHTVTTTTTTTAVSTHVTLTRPTPAPAPPHPSLGTAQAAWHSYFTAISTALDDPRHHSLQRVPLLLAALLHTIASNILHANLAYWAAVAALPRALLPRAPPLAALSAAAASRGSTTAPAGAARPQQRRDQGQERGVCGGLAGVAVAYLDYALAMACAGLEILNATTAAWCCVTHSAHVYLAEAFAPPPPHHPPPDPGAAAAHKPSRRRSLAAMAAWPLRAAYAVLAAKGGLLAAAVWGVLGLWHLVISACCVLLGSCNLLASLFAAAVQRCAAGAGYLPPRLVAADLAQPLYQSSARSLALCSLTGLHGCTYFYWAHLALCGAWLRLAALPRAVRALVWCPVAACVRVVGHALLMVAAVPADA